MLDVKDIYSGYGEVEILHGVSIHVEKGSITCLIGPNGSGKSTVFKATIGILRIKNGSVVFDDEDITNLKTDQIVRKGLSYIPQGRRLFMTLTVEENLEMGGYIKRPEEVQDAIDMVYQIFPRLKERRQLKASSLSGGEQQMLSMGRALMLNPKMILVDEPSLGLDPKITAIIFEKLKEINKRGTTLLMIEQNARRALQMSDQAYVLDLGKIRYRGTGKEVLDDKEVQRLYVGVT